jgi:hypothetical protein
LKAKQSQATSQLVRYSAMCTAIAAAGKIDEVKNIRDKAVALALYAKQANNHEAERLAQNIRIRAERRAGEPLASMPKAKGAAEPGTNRGKVKSATRSRDATASPLASLGVTKQRASEWQRLAKVPEGRFEKILADLGACASGRKIVERAASDRIFEKMKSSPDERQKYIDKQDALFAKDQYERTLEQICCDAFLQSEAGKKLISRIAEVITIDRGLMAYEKTKP